MKYRIILFVLLLFYMKYIFSFDVESVSVSDIVKATNEFQVKIKLQTEELKPAIGMNPTVDFNEYLNKPFDSIVINPMEEYLTENFSIILSNHRKLRPSDIKIAWDEKSKFSDHPMIVVSVNYKLEGSTDIPGIVVKNSLLVQEIPSQKNIVNVYVDGKTITQNFLKEKQTQEIDFL